MKLILTTLLIFLATVVPGWSADSTNQPAKSSRHSEFTGQVLDEYGYPTNTTIAYAQGQTDARHDLTNGVLTLKTCGLPSPDAFEYWTLLEKRCGVKTIGLAGCMVTDGLLKYEEGYNDVASTYIQQKFGTNIFDELEKEASAKHQGAQTDTPGTYKIRDGDTLLKIAHDRHVTLKALLKANPKLEPTKLQIGQKIIIPAQGTSP